MTQTLETERLRYIADSDHVQCGDAAALARELLSCREEQLIYTAERESHITDYMQDQINYYVKMLAEKSAWIACSDRMPREGDYVIVAPEGGVTQCVTYFWEDCPINGKPMWFTHSEECDPVPLAEFTHWMPLPEAPRPEK